MICFTIKYILKGEGEVEQRCQFSGNFLISGNLARNFLISGNFTMYNRIGTYTFPGNFWAFQEILTKMTGISGRGNGDQTENLARDRVSGRKIWTHYGYIFTFLMMSDKNLSYRTMQWRSHWGLKGWQSAPLDSEKFAKYREKEGENQEKEGKIGEKRKNQEGYFTLPLLTDSLGCTTGTMNKRIGCTAHVDKFSDWSVCVFKKMITLLSAHASLSPYQQWW